MYSSNPSDDSAPAIPSERQVLTWLRRHIHPYCWGRSDRLKEHFTQTTRSQVLDFFRALRFDLPRRHLPRLPNSLMMGHFVGMHILYFQADGRYETPEVIICIDIDCHDRGSYEGACACVNWLIDNGFPGLFWSRSTNGRGVHAYLRVVKPETNARCLDRGLLELERWLKYQLTVQKWDIQDIEVKGRPPVFSWGDEKYDLIGVKMGSLAKLPVDALDRPIDLMNSTLKRVDELCRLGSEVPGKLGREEGEDNCTTYSLPLSNEPFDDIDLDEIKPFVPDSRNREWPLWVERMAQLGLIEDDTMSEVVFELAKWLLWVELFVEEDRTDRTIELLQGYVLEKHNGFVTRLNEGKEREVLSHVERIVEGACDMSSESKELFLRVRQKRELGKYRRMINIVPLIETAEFESEVSGTADVPGEREGICTTYCFSIRNDLLPPDLEDSVIRYAKRHRMQQRNGDYPISRFARRFLNLLWDNNGSARIHCETLTSMAGNVNQQNRYKQALLGMGLVRDWTGTYRSKTASALYRMTDEAKHAFEAEYIRRNEAVAV